MEKRKIKQGTYKAAYVEWVDSTMRSTVWWKAQDLFDDTKKAQDTFQTVSYLVNENSLEYIFCGSIHFQEGKAVAMGQIFSIPKGCVTKLKFF